MKKTILLILVYYAHASYAQLGGFVDDDIELGGDIFSDFSEEITEKEMAEDERFYRLWKIF